MSQRVAAFQASTGQSGHAAWKQKGWLSKSNRDSSHTRRCGCPPAARRSPVRRAVTTARRNASGRVRCSPGMPVSDEEGNACAAAGKAELAQRDGENESGKSRRIRCHSPRHGSIGNARDERFRGESRFASLFLLPGNGSLDKARLSKNGNFANSRLSSRPAGEAAQAADSRRPKSPMANRTSDVPSNSVDLPPVRPRPSAPLRRRGGFATWTLSDN